MRRQYEIILNLFLKKFIPGYDIAILISDFAILFMYYVHFNIQS